MAHIESHEVQDGADTFVASDVEISDDIASNNATARVEAVSNRHADLIADLNKIYLIPGANKDVPRKMLDRTADNIRDAQNREAALGYYYGFFKFFRDTYTWARNISTFLNLDLEELPDYYDDPTVATEDKTQFITQRSGTIYDRTADVYQDPENYDGGRSNHDRNRY